MSSRFNTIYLGEPGEAADALENFYGVSADEIDTDELRRGLINALRRIADLERRVANLLEPVT